MAAEADEPLEMNYVRKHAVEQAEELNISLRQAATRVFSNAAGSYSANVGLAVESGASVDEQQLQELGCRQRSERARGQFQGISNEKGVVSIENKHTRKTLQSSPLKLPSLDTDLH